jgi:hypothetical protein
MQNAHNFEFPYLSDILPSILQSAGLDVVKIGIFGHAGKELTRLWTANIPRAWNIQIYRDRITWFMKFNHLHVNDALLRVYRHYCTYGWENFPPFSIGSGHSYMFLSFCHHPWSSLPISSISNDTAPLLRHHPIPFHFSSSWFLRRPTPALPVKHFKTRRQGRHVLKLASRRYTVVLIILLGQRNEDLLGTTLTLLLVN